MLQITVDISALPFVAEPVYDNLFTILKIRIEERRGTLISRKSGGFTLNFPLDSAISNEAISITDTKDGVVISGNNFNALLFGAGKFGWRQRSALLTYMLTFSSLYKEKVWDSIFRLEESAAAFKPVGYIKIRNSEPLPKTLTGAERRVRYINTLSFRLGH